MATLRATGMREDGRDVHTLPASRLERVFGKGSGEWTIDDLLAFVREHGIRLVTLMHVGGDGWLKTLDFVPRDYVHLRNIITAGERADGSSLFGNLGIRTGRSDIVLRPRVETAFLNPFSPEPALSLLCGHFGPAGAPLPESPDTMLVNAYERARRETGADLHALGEVEFFLGRGPEEADMYGENDRGYHATSPFVFGEDVRRRAMVLLAEMGVPIKYAHSEVGYVEPTGDDPVIWEQHELELSLQPLPRAAESVLLTMWVLRNLARHAGMRCSFAPLLREGHAGSGMHFHLSPVVAGEHLAGENESGELHEQAKWLIAGLSRIGGALMAFGNRDASSFIRLTQGKEAPSAVSWGKFNRRALIRLPMVATDAEGRPVSPPTIEFRLPDGSAHPHLLLAGVAQAFVAGGATEELDSFLARASLDESGGGDGVGRVPRTPREVSEQLRAHLTTFSAGDVMPVHALEKMIEHFAAM
ncbi:MAG: Glutamine synthetase [Calditrichaeota bacterium]|nr:Glutamine synthetase [Calditrichota bacterium]